MQFLLILVVGLMCYGGRRLRRTGRLNVRLICVGLGALAFSVVFFEGTPDDTFTGESAIAGAIVGLVVTVFFVASYWTTYGLWKRKTGRTIREPDSIPW